MTGAVCAAAGVEQNLHRPSGRCTTAISRLGLQGLIGAMLLPRSESLKWQSRQRSVLSGMNHNLPPGLLNVLEGLALIILQHRNSSLKFPSMAFYPKEYDLIVVGAGHAGCEGALAAARMGLKVLLFNLNLDTMAQMACNPAVGGLAKGHLVKEIDALGGAMGHLADLTGHPVPHPEPLQGAGGAGHPGPVRQAGLPPGHEVPAGT